MIKLLGIVSLGAAFACGFAGFASGQAPPPFFYPPPPVVLHAHPGDAGVPTPLYEGRSVHRMWNPGVFEEGSDEAGYQTGDQQNPRTGD